MIGENMGSENFIKDTSSSLAPYQNTGIKVGFHIKANKLITALYMVTDIMDKDEPLRNKLRNLGGDILSDIYSFSYRTDIVLVEKNIIKINEILSFLEIALTVRIVSEMNHAILKKEFLNLKESFEKHNNQISIEDFLNQTSEVSEDYLENKNSSVSNITENEINKKNSSNGQSIQNKQGASTRIGVQKGSTLLKALKDIKTVQNFKISDMSNRNNFDNLKKERREAIIKIIKDKKQATITDIKLSAVGQLALCGEKTLQRELIAMVSEGVLNKIGEKRWSKYSLKF